MKTSKVIKKIKKLYKKDFKSTLVEDTFIEFNLKISNNNKTRTAIFKCNKCNNIYQNSSQLEKLKQEGWCNDCLSKINPVKIIKLESSNYKNKISYDTWFRNGRNLEKERTAVFKCNKCLSEYVGNAYDESNDSESSTGFCQKCNTLEDLNKNDFKPKLLNDLGFYDIDSNNKKRYAEFECIKCKHSFIKSVKYMLKIQRELCDLCFSKEQYNEKSKLFRVWMGIKGRTSPQMKKNSPFWRSYGSKKICVCKEWNDFKIFEIWALENNYTDLLSIDRMNNDGDYEPGNCRWTTQMVQSRNTRKIQRRNTSGYRGITSAPNNRWRAQISVNYKRKHLGVFSSKIEAALAYDNYVIKHNLEHTINFSYNKNN